MRRKALLSIQAMSQPTLDAFCAVFADAEAALGAAMDAQRALAAEAWSAFGPEFADLRVRMGIHHGKAEERGGDYFGPSLNRTARLMSAGHGGQVRDHVGGAPVAQGRA